MIRKWRSLVALSRHAFDAKAPETGVGAPFAEVAFTLFGGDRRAVFAEHRKESRAAFRACGKDPGRWRVSSEALYRRVRQGRELYRINSVVDVNNLISIESGFSVGSYDAARMGEDLVFRIGEAGETYKGIGKEEIKIDALPVLADEQGAIGSSTSDSERAMITEDAQEVLTLIYSFSDNQDLEKALESGRRYLEQYAKTSGIQSWIVE